MRKKVVMRKKVIIRKKGSHEKKTFCHEKKGLS